eukprot:Phypoly_transcript_08915.p1 GENE.Phypoly_transcript_08915~~Phypoly_transcript_08915.p1  ORF type:complete len:223 (+),score=55.97 Phypoly_transcript_08915:134-802(+)
MLSGNNAAGTSHRTQNKVEKELRKADKEYAKAEKGYQKGSIRRAEKHENRGMAHELKADGITVGSHHGHNEATRVAMLHNSQLTAAQPTIMATAGPAIIPASSGAAFPSSGMAGTGFENQSMRGLSGSQEFLPQSSLGGQQYAQQSSFGNSFGGQGFAPSSLGTQQQSSLGSYGSQQSSFVPQNNFQQQSGQQANPNTISIPHGPGMTTTITTHNNNGQQRF